MSEQIHALADLILCTEHPVGSKHRSKIFDEEDNKLPEPGTESPTLSPSDPLSNCRTD